MFRLLLALGFSLVSAVVHADTAVSEAEPETDFLPLPQVAHYQDVAYVTGGVGLEESSVIKQQYKRYALRMAFTEGRDAAYVVGVAVKILDKNQRARILAVEQAGPLLYVDLPVGHYAVIAQYQGVQQSQRVSIEPSSTNQPNVQRVFFNWKLPVSSIAPASSTEVTTDSSDSAPRAGDADDLSIP